MIRTFFGKQPKERDAPRTADTPRGVPYDPALITALTHQHRELVLLLVKASSAAEQCYYAEATEALTQFRQDLAEHLQREDSQLIPYLSHHLWGEGIEELVRDMRANSRHIERAVKNFLDSYLYNPVDAESLNDFLIEVDRVCEDFSQAVEREEVTFYTLYMAPEAY